MIIFDETLTGASKGAPITIGKSSKLLIKTMAFPDTEFKLGLELYVFWGKWLRVEEGVADKSGGSVYLGDLTDNLPEGSIVRVALTADEGDVVQYRAMLEDGSLTDNLETG